MNKVGLILFLVFAGFSTALVQASPSPYSEGVSEWIHITRQTGNITLAIDYRIGCYTYSQGTVCSANPLWLNVYGAAYPSSVHVVFLNHCPNAETEIREVDLGYDSYGRKFTGDIPYGTKHQINGCWQEVAFSVNGDWSTRYNGGRNFTLDMMNPR